jgi:hypothetical protein
MYYLQHERPFVSDTQTRGEGEKHKRNHYREGVFQIILFINFTINKTIEGTDNRTEESQIKSYLHITMTL